ncbi:hypothetical protein SAMN04487981_103616 [Streptomyces sp. cf386]|uniref:hypothetical protein n=1 Tax=Streptomyces sp. cf386 TaxID=1761904 RepID=UPI00088D4847|nr:hypothetical protein [Streptomyces sp. cf386]SDN11441.1 hypothetical protein SAMN04487981_103616 [Streptomyces sp. cf386]
MRRMRVAAVCGAAVMATVGGVAPDAGAVGGPEPALAYHGSLVLAAGQADVRFTPHVLGSAAASGEKVTVLLRWSAPLAERQELPQTCVLAQPQVVMCRVEGPDADGVGPRVGLRVRLQGAPSEVLVEFGTLRSGQQLEELAGQRQQQVLALDTGDTYYF